MEENTFDIVVVGAGPAGYIAAIQAARLGARTAIIEKDQVGGTCLNRGCIPTKYYLKSAEIIEERLKASSRGITFASDEYSIDMPKAVKDKQKVVKKLTGGVKSLLNANKVTIYSDTAIVTGADKVSLKGGQTLSCKAVILAGGSQPGSIPIPGADDARVITSDSILDLQQIPERLIIIGGGVIGIEMSMIFNAFGSKVTVIEAEERIIPFAEMEASKLLADSCTKKGIVIKCGVRMERIEGLKESITACLTDGSRIEGDLILMSVGRKPDLSALTEALVKQDRGMIAVNDHMETSVPGIFAPGDINGKKMLAHAAFQMAETAAFNAAIHAGVIQGAKKSVDLSLVPSVVYSFPEVAWVGLSEQEARKMNPQVVTGTFPLAANGRALASGAPEGFVKVIAEERYGQILGVTIVGLHASEMIAEAVLAMSMEITVHELSETVHAHPTISEALQEAAADCLRRALHLMPRN